MPTFQNSVSGNVTIAADGTGTIRLGPERAGEKWLVKRQTIQNNTTGLNQCQCRVYRNLISATTLVDGTYTGTFDVSTDSISVDSGFLIAQWTGATPGTVSTWILDVEVTR